MADSLGACVGDLELLIRLGFSFSGETPEFRVVSLNPDNLCTGYDRVVVIEALEDCGNSRVVLRPTMGDTEDLYGWRIETDDDVVKIDVRRRNASGGLDEIYYAVYNKGCVPVGSNFSAGGVILPNPSVVQERGF